MPEAVEIAEGAAGGALPGLDLLTASVHALESRQAFRPTDPGQEAHAHAIPTGLIETVAEDVDGLEQEQPFGRAATGRPVVAIDAGVIKLGQTATGVVGAVRAAAMIHHPDGHRELRTYRPGAFYLHTGNRLGLFHGMGRALGRDDFYVEMKDDRPVREKVELSLHDHRLIDRARNFVERLVQHQLCGEFENSIIALDGALTLRTYDTPQVFLRRLHETCQERGNTLVAVAKKTGLTIRGVDIRILLDRKGGLPGRRRLTRAIREEERKKRDLKRMPTHRSLGDLYVARFSPGGETYRIDVDPAPGIRSTAAIDEFVAACLFRSGYPEPLIEAHAFSYMPPPIVAQLQANAIVTHELVVHPEPNLGPVFAPFGGRYR